MLKYYRVSKWTGATSMRGNGLAEHTITKKSVADNERGAEQLPHNAMPGARVGLTCRQLMGAISMRGIGVGQDMMMEEQVQTARGGSESLPHSPMPGARS